MALTSRSASPAEIPHTSDLLVPESRTARRGYYSLLVLLLAALLTPIWSNSYPAMLDYPNHLARAYILHHLRDVPAYANTYEAAWRPLPNLATDLVVHPLLYIVDVEVASKLFLSLLIVLFAIGCHLLGSAAHGRPTWLALPTMFLVYNFFFSSGFVNYLFGLGLSFMALAIWVRWRDRWTARAILLSSLVTCAAYLSHLAAFGLVALSTVLLVGFEAFRSQRMPGGRQLIGLSALVPPLILWIVYRDPTSQVHALEWWHPVIAKKLIGLAYPIVSYRVYLDLALGAILFGLPSVAFIAARRRHMHGGLLLIGCVLLVLYAICPMAGFVESTYLDRRLVVPAVVILLLSFNAWLPRWAARLLVAALVIVGLLRLSSIAHFWSDVSGEIESQVRLLDRLPDGARIFPLTMQDASDLLNYPRDMCFKNVVHYGTIRRHTFSPSIFASPAAFPLGMKPRRTDYVDMRPETDLSEIDWDFVLSHYDFLWGYKLRQNDEVFLSSRCDLVARAGQAVLFRTARKAP